MYSLTDTKFPEALFFWFTERILKFFLEIIKQISNFQEGSPSKQIFSQQVSVAAFVLKYYILTKSSIKQRKGKGKKENSTYLTAPFKKTIKRIVENGIYNVNNNYAVFILERFNISTNFFLFLFSSATKKFNCLTRFGRVSRVFCAQGQLLGYIFLNTTGGN